MAHKHSVHDTDAHFVINPTTREITNQSDKTTIIQHDHNSERFTFEVSTVDGHDMSLCNSIQVHYINIDSATKNQNIGVYEVNDMEISSDDDETVVFTWLISNNATQFAGILNFLIKFKCVADDGTVDYVWNTAIYKGIVISNGIDNGEVIAKNYPDILAEWESRIEALENKDSGGLSITDDGEGNVAITSSGSVTITDDGNGNVTIA